MKFVRTSRPKIPFREVVSRDVFYSEDFGNYGMRIAAKMLPVIQMRFC